MSKTEVSGKQVKDGTIDTVDLSSSLQSTISGKAESADVTALDTRVTAVESDVAALQSAGAPNLSDLGEVSITSPSSGQVLKYNGTGWANAADSTFSGSYTDLTNKPTIPSALDDLSDVTISSPSNDQVLKYNGTAWVNSAAPAAGATDLDGLSDVAVTSAARGQFIVHNGTQFVNSNTIEASDAAVKPLIVKGAASQTANLFETQNSSGTSLVSVQSSGKLTVAGGDGSNPALAITGLYGKNGVAFPTMASSGIYAGNYEVGVNDYQAILKLVASNASAIGVIDWHTANVSNFRQRLLGQTAGGLELYTSNSANTDRNVVAEFNGWSNTKPSLRLTARSAAAQGLIVQAAASQTANVVEVQNSAAANMFLIDATGSVQISDKKVGATASTLYLTTTNVYSRILSIQQPASHSSNCIQILNSAGTVLSAFGSDGQLYDNGMAVLSYRSYQTMTANGGNTSYPGSAMYNTQVWVNGVQKTSGTHYNVNGSWIEWTSGNTPASGSTVEIFGTPNNWRNSAGDGNGFGYFPVVSIGSKKPGTSNIPMLTTEVLSAARKGIVLKAAASQTANLFEVQDSSSNILFRITSAGVPVAPYNMLLGDDVVVGRGPASLDVRLGKGAIPGGTGIANVAVGDNSLYSKTTGEFNAALGHWALFHQTTGSNSVGVGSYAGAYILGNQNTAIGARALMGPDPYSSSNNATGNTAVGYYAMNGVTTATYATAIGWGSNSTSHGVAIGAQANASGNYALAIGRSASAAADCMDIRFGNAQRIVGDANGQIGINEASPGAQLHVTSGAAARKGLIVKGAASQTANLIEAQNSSGTALFSVDSAGSLSAGTVPVARVTGLHAVATSGSYADLTNKPTITSVAIYQDAEFTWTSSGSATTRTITHNKGRFPDMVKVFFKNGNSWVEHIDRLVYAEVNYGWDTATSSSTVNAHAVRLWSIDLGLSSALCRIRLYWFGDSDVATASSGWVA